MANSVKFRTVLSVLKKGEQACYIGRPIHNGTRDRAYLVEKVSARSGMDKKTAGYAIDLFVDQLGVEMSDGYRVEYGDLAGNLTIQGGFKTKDAAWEVGRNRLVPRLHCKGDLAGSVMGVKCENETPSASVIIKSVVDTVLKTESTLPARTNVTVYVAGTGLITSTDATSGEGVWLEDETTGIVVAVGTVTASTMTTLNATFAEMPEPGKYRFAIATRGGLGSEYGVVVEKRKVKVVAVNA